MATYQIYELSARAVMSYAAEKDGVYIFALNRSATEHCKVPGAKHEQDSCAMFHQLMYQLHGEGWRERGDEKVTLLSDVLFYMDFAGIFEDVYKRQLPQRALRLHAPMRRRMLALPSK